MTFNSFFVVVCLFFVSAVEWGVKNKKGNCDFLSHNSDLCIAIPTVGYLKFDQSLSLTLLRQLRDKV